MSLYVSDKRNELPVVRNDWSKIQLDLLQEIFNRLTPESLAMCSGVCQYWNNVSSSAHFYFQWAAQVRFFCCPEGDTYFADKSKPRFIQHYSALHALPSVEGKTRFEALKYYQSEEGSKVLQKIWNEMLPSKEELKKNIVACLKAFDYQAKLPKLTACIYAGADVFEDPFENRLFAIGCFHGDTEMVERVVKKISPELKLFVYIDGIIVAIEGHQPKVIEFLQNKWGRFPREIILNNYEPQWFEPGGPYADMASCLTED